MSKRHLFSLNAPKNWPIERKRFVWVTRPNPGPHGLSNCLPVSLLIKNVLKYSKNMRETKYILNAGEILINNKIIKDHKFPVGIMDSIEVKKTKEFFRLLLDENHKYFLQKINEDESKSKLCKVINKKVLGKGKIQINLFDGRNVIINKDDYKVGDTVILDLVNNKIVDHLKLDKNVMIYITDGKYTGYIGHLNDIIINKRIQDKNKIIFTKDGKKFETLKDYAFVIPKEFFK